MENLKDHLSYDKDADRLKDIFLALDDQLKIFHQRGYTVSVNPKYIEYSDDVFVFTQFAKNYDDMGKRRNIEDLAKLAVGTYFSIPSGQFVDYTSIPTSYLREQFENLNMDDSVPKATEDDSYYKDVIVFGRNDIYYNDYLINLRAEQNRNRTSTKSTVKSLGTIGGNGTVVKDRGIPKEQLNETPNSQSAYINILFYPILAVVAAMVAYIINIVLNLA